MSPFGDQMSRMPDDIRRLWPSLPAAAARALDEAGPATLERVVVAGSGDSYAAGLAAASGLSAVLPCEVRPTAQVALYGAAGGERSRGRTLLVVVSASGRTLVVVDALRRAHADGVATLLVTGQPASPAGVEAGAILAAPLDPPAPGPGLRTYLASFLALESLAGALAGRSGGEPTGPEGGYEHLAAGLERTIVRLGRGPAAASLLPADAPVAAAAGTGPSLGSAHFLAAKLAEVAGLPVLAGDLEEWWHVGRFCRPHDMPVIVIGPPGPSHRRAVRLAAQAAELGRRPLLVTAPCDCRADHPGVPAVELEPVPDRWSPVHVAAFTGWLAGAAGAQRGHEPFTARP